MRRNQQHYSDVFVWCCSPLLLQSIRGVYLKLIYGDELVGGRHCAAQQAGSAK